MKPVRSTLLAASHSARVKRNVERFESTRSVVERFVGGTTSSDVVAVATQLAMSGRLTTIDYLGEDVTDDEGADATVAAYLEVAPLLKVVGGGDLSVKLSALGLVLDADGALARARKIVAAASAEGLSVTIDMESSELTDRTLDVVSELRRETPSVAAVLQAMLKRTESDARELARAGARVRLCKGAYAESPSVAFTRREEVNASYFRSLRVLWDSSATPLVASHDPVIVAYARELAAREPRNFEFQMLYGIRPDEQSELVSEGHTVRVYVPYGDQWYGYLMRRLAERPANLTFFLRSLASKR